jgi:hypothetical protein
MTSTRRNLVVVNAGDTSLHPRWLNEASSRNFDMFVSYFGNVPDKFRAGADYYENLAGLKWPTLARLCSQRQELFSMYDAFWFPDEDILADTRTICRMFDLFHASNLWLAQPALGAGSFATYKELLQIRHARLRFTDFVEVMCPLFNRQALAVLNFTFSLSVSGWGLDLLWPHLLNYPEDRIGILDETPVIHTRRVGSGPLYLHLAEIGINPQLEVCRLIRRYHIPRGPGQSANIQVYKTFRSAGGGAELSH